MTDDGLTMPEDRDIKVDTWLVRAAREYRSGWIDQPLWAQILAESGNDESQAKAVYIRARAKLLHQARRDRRARRAAKKINLATESPAEAAPTEARRRRRKRADSTFRFMPYAATMLGLIAMAAGIWVVVANQQGTPLARPHIASPIARPEVASSVRSTNSPKVSADATSVATAAARAEDTQVAFPEKIAKLIEAKNWNMAVIYASDWTRKEPTNVNAWIHLGNAYTAIGQFRDAFDAATKAAELAPDDPRVWRSLGHVNIALDRSEEAKAAFDKAVAANPGDTEALCGQVLVARQQGRTKDADAIAIKVQSLGPPCLNEHETVSVPVVAKGSTSQRPAERSRR
jgi:Flp pilus assembly protein TadD